MDVKLPDGTIIKNVPEGTTKSQLTAKLQKSGYDISKLMQSAAPQVRANVGAEEPSTLEKLKSAAKGYGQYQLEQLAGEALGMAAPAETLMSYVRPGYERGMLEQAVRAQGIEPSKTAEVMGEMIPGMALGAGVGAGLKALSAAPRIAEAAPAIARTLGIVGEATQTGGLARPAAETAAGRLAARIAGGAISGAAGVAATRPEDIGAGAATGAAIGGIAGPVIGKAGQFISSFQNPKGQALLKATGDKIENIITELKKGGEIVPGTQPHAGIAATPAESAGFSSLVKSLFANPEVKKVIGNVLADTQATDDLARDLYSRGLFKTADDAKQALLSQVSPEAIPERATAALRAGLGQQQAALEAGAREQAGAIPVAPSQMALGEQVSKAREAAVKTAKEQITTPAYEKAFKLSGNKPFDVSGIVDVSKQIRKQPATKFNRDIAPLTSEVLATFKPEEITGKIVGVSGKPLTPTKEVNEATLRDVDGLIKAINADIASVRKSSHPDAPSTLRNLQTLKTSAENAIQEGLPGNVQKAYKEARQLYKTEVIDPYFKDWTVKLQRESSTGVPQLRGSDVVPTILNTEEAAAQFNKGLGKNEDARNAVKLGIQDLYREKVIDPVSGVANFGKHAKFMQDNAKVLKVLDQGGMGITDTLNQYGKQAKGIETAMDALAERAKGLQYATPEAMLKDFGTNYEKLQRGLKVMDEPAKQQVARGLMADVLDRSPDDAINQLKTNKSIRIALEAAHPKDAAKILKGATDQMELLKLATAGENMLNPKFPSMMNDLARQKKIAELTSRFSPEQMKDFQALQKEAARAKTFDELAKIGGFKGDEVVTDLLEEANVGKKPIPAWFNQVATFARHYFDRFETKLNKKQAIELAQVMINPKLAAQALEDAKAWQASRAVKNIKAAQVGGAVTRGGISAVAGGDRNKLRQAQ